MDGEWRTIRGVHVLIGKDGSILKGPKALQKKDIQKKLKKQFENKNKELEKKIESIRNSKKENLIVTDENGNIIHEELGNTYHTGYDNIDYKNTITYHNHPEKTMPYPSEQDFKTLEKTGMKKMVVVSKDYTVEYSLDENYKGVGRQGLSSVISNNTYNIDKIKNEIRTKITNEYKEGKYSSPKEANAKLKSEITFAVLKKYEELSKNSGYKLTFKKEG